MSLWPDCANQLLSELKARPGRLALVVDDSYGQIMESFAGLLGIDVTRAGTRLLSQSPPATPDQVIEQLVTGSYLVADLDLLFWKPWLALDPLGILRTISRRRPGTVFHWPGTLRGNRATYSTPGRRDFFEATLIDAVVLFPQPVVFPDNPPYRIERFT